MTSNQRYHKNKKGDIVWDSMYHVLFKADCWSAGKESKNCTSTCWSWSRSSLADLDQVILNLGPDILLSFARYMSAQIALVQSPDLVSGIHCQTIWEIQFSLLMLLNAT